MKIVNRNNHRQKERINVKISQVLTMDVGQTGIAIEGEIKYAGKPPKLVSGNGPNGDYAFWTQFIAVKDDTGEIGANVGVAEGQTLTVGQHIRIEKARLESYINGKKETVLTLGRGKLAQPVDKQGQQAAGQQKSSGGDTNSIINRQSAWRGLCDLFAQSKDEVTVDKLLPLVLQVAKVLETGKIAVAREPGADDTTQGTGEGDTPW
jgi:hypothetical protein